MAISIAYRVNASRFGRGELLLFRRLRETGDPVLRDELIERYLGLAAGLARRYASAGRSPTEDLVQVGRLGLVLAVDRFDPDRGFAFVSFAVPTITGEIKRYFRGATWSTHVPRGLQETSLAVERTAGKMTMRDGRSPNVPALAAELDLTDEVVIDALQATQHAVSLDAPIPGADGEGDGEETLIDSVGGSDAGYELAEDRVTVDQACAYLSDRDQRILKLRFEAELTQQEIAGRLGVSQMQISRLLRASLQRLREAGRPVPPSATDARHALGRCRTDLSSRDGRPRAV